VCAAAASTIRRCSRTASVSRETSVLAATSGWSALGPACRRDERLAIVPAAPPPPNATSCVQRPPRRSGGPREASASRARRRPRRPFHVKHRTRYPPRGMWASHPIREDLPWHIRTPGRGWSWSAPERAFTIAHLPTSYSTTPMTRRLTANPRRDDCPLPTRPWDWVATEGEPSVAVSPLASHGSAGLAQAATTDPSHFQRLWYRAREASAESWSCGGCVATQRMATPDVLPPTPRGARRSPQTGTCFARVAPGCTPRASRASRRGASGTPGGKTDAAACATPCSCRVGVRRMCRSADTFIAPPGHRASRRCQRGQRHQLRCGARSGNGPHAIPNQAVPQSEPHEPRPGPHPTTGAAEPNAHPSGRPRQPESRRLPYHATTEPVLERTL